MSKPKNWDPFSQRTLTAVWLRGKWSGTTLSLATTTLSHQMYVSFIIYVRDAATTPEFAMLITRAEGLILTHLGHIKSG